jgi:hypothetical protein
VIALGSAPAVLTVVDGPVVVVVRAAPAAPTEVVGLDALAPPPPPFGLVVGMYALGLVALGVGVVGM